MTFGNRLKELRLKKGLTQEELAMKIKMSKANVSKYELDSVEPSLETIKFLADFFGVTTDYLIGFTNETNKQIQRVNFDDIDNISDCGQDMVATEIKCTGTEEELKELIDFMNKNDYYYYGELTPTDNSKNNKTVIYKNLPSTKFEKIIKECSDLSTEDIKKVLEYIECIKSKK